MIKSKYQSIKAYLITGELPTDLPSTQSNFRREASHYEIGSDGILKREGKTVALYKDRKALFDCYHATHSGNHSARIDNSILGRDITWKKIKERYYWRGGQAYVARKVKECTACAYKNNTIWKAGLPPLTAIPVIPKPFWRLNLDFIGPFSRSRNGNAYVGLAVCDFTKYVEAAGKNQNKKLGRERVAIPSRFKSTTTPPLQGGQHLQ